MEPTDEIRDRISEMIRTALEERVTDIHVECFENRGQIRFRIDGVLQARESLTPEEQRMMVLQLKVMGQMDITEKRRPQDSRILFDVDGETIDIRVSCAPVVFGESLTMRLLSKSELISDFSDLGLNDDQQALLGDWYQKPSGLIIVTGPTGSGKTTLLYNILSVLNTEERKIFTAEDPVEYAFDGIDQMPIRPSVGLTFSAALRSMLRQAPNVIMVGEIRDMETANMVVAAACTGHLVLTTLNTVNATQVITRLTDMGVAPFLLRDVVIGTIAMRLVRKLCPECREEYQPEGSIIKMLKLPHDKYWRGNGCEKCRQTGFKGRVALHEFFAPADGLYRKLAEGVPGDALRHEAVGQGLKTLWDDGVRKCSEGLTTLPEVVRVLGAPEVF